MRKTAAQVALHAEIVDYLLTGNGKSRNFPPAVPGWARSPGGPDVTRQADIDRGSALAAYRRSVGFVTYRYNLPGAL